MNTNAVNSNAGIAVNSKKQRSGNNGADEGFLRMLNSVSHSKKSTSGTASAGRDKEKISSKRENSKNKTSDADINAMENGFEAYPLVEAEISVGGQQESETAENKEALVTPKFVISVTEAGMFKEPGISMLGGYPDKSDVIAKGTFSGAEANGSETPDIGRGHSRWHNSLLNAKNPENEAAVTTLASLNLKARNEGRPDTSIRFSEMARNLSDAGAEVEAGTYVRQAERAESARWIARPEMKFSGNVESAMDNAIDRAARELRMAKDSESRIADMETLNAETDISEAVQAVRRGISNEAAISLGREERISGETEMLERSERTRAETRREIRGGIRENEQAEEQSTAGIAVQAQEPREAAQGVSAQQTQRARTFQAPQAAQIQAEVVRNLENRDMQFTMRLSPEELGQIDVKMALQGGKLMIEIISSSRVSEILSRQTDSLAAALRQDAVGDITSVEVVTETRSFMGNMDSAFDMNGRGYGQDANTNRGSAGNSLNEFHDALEEAAQAEYESSSLLNYAI